MKWILMVGIFLSLTSCANIPLGTMLKLSSFDDDTFLALKPEDLNSKIHLDKPFTINLNKTSLSLILVTLDGEIKYDFPLKLKSKRTVQAENGWLSSIPERTEYIFVLSRKAIDSFIELQQAMRYKPTKNTRFIIKTRFNDTSTKPSNIYMSIFIKLDKDDYITLIDRASVEVH